MKNSYTKPGRNNFFSDMYGTAEWFCIKLSLVCLIWPGLIYTLFHRTGQPYPNGICTCVDCSLLTYGMVKYMAAALLVCLAVLYLAEKKMAFTTLLIFVMAVLIYSLEESNGEKGRRGILSLVFFAQFLAYRFRARRLGSDLAKNRVQFSGQVIAAVYVLSALSKLYTSGLGWITDSPHMALQVLKSYTYSSIDTGLPGYAERGNQIAGWIAGHTVAVQILVGFSLLLELFSFVLLLKKKWAFFYAWLLLAMHLGIWVVMNIYFPTVSNPMVIFFINPLYLLFLMGQSLYAAIRPRPRVNNESFTPHGTDF